MKVVVHVDGGVARQPGPGRRGRRGLDARRRGARRGVRVPRRARRTTSPSTAGCCSGSTAREALGADRGRGRQRLRARRQAGQRPLQGQAPGHEAAARRGAGGAARLRPLDDPHRCRGRRTRTPTRSSTRRSTPRADRVRVGHAAVRLTDGGLETSLIYDQGLDLPDFAAFPLVETEEGRDALRRYFEPVPAIAREHGTGFVWTRRPGGPTATGASGSATTPSAWARSTARPRRSPASARRASRTGSSRASSARAATATSSTRR